ncbi:MAG TPA: Ig-like domain repeat protein, partial [Candidatus Angelobacter sp.]
MTSVLLAWAIIMGSMPAYGTDQPRMEWVHTWNFGAGSAPETTQAPHPAAPTMAVRPSSGKTVLTPRLAGNQMIAALHAPLPSNLSGNQGPDFFLNAFGGNLFTPPFQAQDSQLQISVAFADNSSASANFPEPWNEANPLINFVGGGTVYRAGAIRLDNPGSSPITADNVKVDLGRPGPVFQLWQNIVVPAGGSAILTQTDNGNFNTSASPIVGCGLSLASNETRIPKITVTVAGASTDYLDAAHVLDTGGFDSSCRGNQSLEWRPVGTTGVESPGGSIELVSDGAPHAVGTQDTLTVQINDAGNQPLANSPVKLNVLNGPNVGKSFTGVTDNTGAAVIQYSSSAQGNDLIQAVVNNLSGGSLPSQQATATWSSADACAAPASPSAAAARLIYVGQNSVSFGDTMRLAVLLTDGTGNPLSGRSVSFTFAGNTSPATTDGNGTAMVPASTLPVGQSTINIRFAGDAGYQPAQLSAAVTVLPAPTLLRYTGANLVTALGTQQVSAVLTNSLGTTPVAGRTVTFTMNGISASGVTGVNGNAAATLNFATAQPTGAGQLQISFAGDANYRPSSRTAAVQIYQPMPFVIWGGNTGGLRIGQRVNFWGSQWESQVINGQYFAANPSFKGWSGALTGPIQQCLPNVTQATLTSACWDVKPGQSFPPNQVLPSLIEVIVSTVVDKSGSDVFGNIACGAILAVDHTPPYGAVPGQDGFGTIAAVSGDCAGVFPAPAVLVGSQQQTSMVLPNQGVPINYSIRNSGATDATGVTLNESFDQVTPASATANIGTIGAGLTNTGSFQVTIPAIGARQGAESSVDYQSRLAAQDGRLFSSQAEATFTDVFAQIYAPVDFSSFSQLTLPRLSVGISGSSCIAPGSTVPYQVSVENGGSAKATHIAATLTLPDGTTATPVVPDLVAGTKFAGTVSWQSPGIGGKLPTESTQDYLARLQAADGATLPAAIFSSTWQDTSGNAYGPVEQPFIALTQRIPVVSTTVPTPPTLLPNQKTQLGFNVSNSGTGNAVQVTLRVKRQDGTFINVPNFSLPGGQSTTVNAAYQAPALAGKGAAESDADYITRLQLIDNSTLNLSAVLNWTDPAQNSYGPTDNPFTATEQLPILSVALDAPAAANSGDSISYTITLTNNGHAAATVGVISITLPDGSIQHPAPVSNSLAPGASTTASVSYAIPANHPNGTISATASATWRDAAANSYGPLSASTSTQVTLPNLPPVVSAGTNQTVPFPNTFPLQGSVTDDGKPVGGQLTSTWTQVSGPVPAIFADPSNPHTTVTLNAEGTYVLKLTGDDSQLQTNALVTISTIRGNKPPVVSAGPDQTIELPTNSVTLSGSASDDGLPAGSSLSYSWTKVAGPGTVALSTPSTPGTSATFSAIGLYILRLTASDSQLSGSADVRITILPHNNPPVVNAGPNQTIFQPANTTTLNGTITDDGLPAGGTLTASWSVVSGPGIVTFASQSSASTSATFAALGVYVLRLTGSDSQLTAQSDVTVTVRPANLPPLVNAGPQQTVILPSNVNTLPLFPTLIPISTGFNSPVGIDYHQPTNEVVMSVNYPSGQPHNFELVAQDGSRTQFSNVAGLTDEVYIATARDEIGGKSIGGFLAGEMFTGSGVGGVIVRISPDGKTILNPWVQLPGESGLLRGQLYIDRTGVFGGDLIIATTTGNIWRVTNAGVSTRLANVGVPPEGLITLPTDPFHYGPWAGKIVTGSENSSKIFTID